MNKELLLPRRKIQVEIKIGADTKEDLEQELKNILLKVSAYDYQSSSLSGGVSSNHYYCCAIDSEQTAEKYQRELKEYVEGLNEQHNF